MGESKDGGLTSSSSGLSAADKKKKAYVAPKPIITAPKPVVLKPIVPTVLKPATLNPVAPVITKPPAAVITAPKPATTVHKPTSNPGRYAPAITGNTAATELASQEGLAKKVNTAVSTVADIISKGYQENSNNPSVKQTNAIADTQFGIGTRNGVKGYTNNQMALFANKMDQGSNRALDVAKKAIAPIVKPVTQAYNASGIPKLVEAGAKKYPETAKVINNFTGLGSANAVLKGTGSAGQALDAGLSYIPLVGGFLGAGLKAGKVVLKSGKVLNKVSDLGTAAKVAMSTRELEAAVKDGSSLHKLADESFVLVHPDGETAFQVTIPSNTDEVSKAGFDALMAEHGTTTKYPEHPDPAKGLANGELVQMYPSGSTKAVKPEPSAASAEAAAVHIKNRTAAREAAGIKKNTPESKVFNSNYDSANLPKDNTEKTMSGRWTLKDAQGNTFTATDAQFGGATAAKKAWEDMKAALPVKAKPESVNGPVKVSNAGLDRVHTAVEKGQTSTTLENLRKNGTITPDNLEVGKAAILARKNPAWVDGTLDVGDLKGSKALDAAVQDVVKQNLPRQQAELLITSKAAQLHLSNSMVKQIGARLDTTLGMGKAASEVVPTAKVKIPAGSEALGYPGLKKTSSGKYTYLPDGATKRVTVDDADLLPDVKAKLDAMVSGTALPNPADTSASAWQTTRKAAHDTALAAKEKDLGRKLAKGPTVDGKKTGELHDFNKTWYAQYDKITPNTAPGVRASKTTFHFPENVTPEDKDAFITSLAGSGAGIKEVAYNGTSKAGIQITDAKTNTVMVIPKADLTPEQISTLIKGSPAPQPTIAEGIVAAGKPLPEAATAIDGVTFEQIKAQMVAEYKAAHGGAAPSKQGGKYNRATGSGSEMSKINHEANVRLGEINAAKRAEIKAAEKAAEKAAGTPKTTKAKKAVADATATTTRELPSGLKDMSPEAVVDRAIDIKKKAVKAQAAAVTPEPAIAPSAAQRMAATPDTLTTPEAPSPDMAAAAAATENAATTGAKTAAPFVEGGGGAGGQGLDAPGKWQMSGKTKFGLGAAGVVAGGMGLAYLSGRNGQADTPATESASEAYNRLYGTGTSGVGTSGAAPYTQGPSNAGNYGGGKVNIPKVNDLGGTTTPPEAPGGGGTPQGDGPNGGYMTEFYMPDANNDPTIGPYPAEIINGEAYYMDSTTGKLTRVPEGAIVTAGGNADGSGKWQLRQGTDGSLAGVKWTQGMSPAVADVIPPEALATPEAFPEAYSFENLMANYDSYIQTNNDQIDQATEAEIKSMREQLAARGMYNSDIAITLEQQIRDSGEAEKDAMYQEILLKTYETSLDYQYKYSQLNIQKQQLDETSRMNDISSRADAAALTQRANEFNTNYNLDVAKFGYTQKNDARDATIRMAQINKPSASSSSVAEDAATARTLMYKELSDSGLTGEALARKAQSYKSISGFTADDIQQVLNQIDRDQAGGK